MSFQLAGNLTMLLCHCSNQRPMEKKNPYTILWSSCSRKPTEMVKTLLDHRDTPTEGVYASPAQRLMSRRTCTLVPTLSLYSPLKSFKFCIEAQVEKEKKPSFTMIFRQSSYRYFKLDKKSEWVPSIMQRSLVETWYLHQEAFGQIIHHTIRWQHTEKKQAVSQTYWTTRQGAC